eukprot:CAMPEP_0169185784 /NCGR_PEP_ID=MMETSP1016-20121227/1991_1 /TAXON_ID=342587 /ORGANISM="Karlodinium micrum, Strain CCMP2283" /LENGTH=148 /DNA_ID=CAMNT_0009261531 /DNA_START=121 /DNA_END=563 /DNA_ORIENTATION=-
MTAALPNNDRQLHSFTVRFTRLPGTTVYCPDGTVTLLSTCTVRLLRTISFKSAGQDIDSNLPTPGYDVQNSLNRNMTSMQTAYTAIKQRSLAPMSKHCSPLQAITKAKIPTKSEGVVSPLATNPTIQIGMYKTPKASKGSLNRNNSGA